MKAATLQTRALSKVLLGRVIAVSKGLYHLLLLISYLKTDSFSIVVVPREAVVRYSICDTDRLFTMAVFTLETDYPFLDG